MVPLQLGLSTCSTVMQKLSENKIFFRYDKKVKTNEKLMCGLVLMPSYMPESISNAYVK